MKLKNRCNVYKLNCYETRARKQKIGTLSNLP